VLHTESQSLQRRCTPSMPSQIIQRRRATPISAPSTNQRIVAGVWQNVHDRHLECWSRLTPVLRRDRHGQSSGPGSQQPHPHLIHTNEKPPTQGRSSQVTEIDQRRNKNKFAANENQRLCHVLPYPSPSAGEGRGVRANPPPTTSRFWSPHPNQLSGRLPESQSASPVQWQSAQSAPPSFSPGHPASPFPPSCRRLP